MLAVTVATAAVSSLTPLTVAQAYGPGARNIWTQGYNTYDENCAYTGSIPCGDPNCNTSSGYNCQQWPYGSESEGGYFHGTWYYNFSDRSSSFHSAIAQAINDASNEPYYSPSFREVWGGDWNCSNVSLCITGSHMGTSGSSEQKCAVTQDYGNPIDYATITFNEDVAFFVGNPGDVSGACSITAIAHHEMGHVLGLGHSSDTSTVMFWAPNVVNYGGDEQAALKAIYLNNYQPRQAGGGDACNTCESECEHQLSQLPASQLELGNPCQEAGAPIPLLTYPGINPQQLVQKPVGAINNEVATVEAIIQR